MYLEILLLSHTSRYNFMIFTLFIAGKLVPASDEGQQLARIDTFAVEATLRPCLP